MRGQKATTNGDASEQPNQPPLEDGEQRLFVHRIELRPDATKCKRPVLVVGFAPGPR